VRAKADDKQVKREKKNKKCIAEKIIMKITSSRCVKFEEHVLLDLRPAELRRRWTITVEQSSCCSVETRDTTTEGLSVPHLMCRLTEETFTTARCCCGVICDFGAGDKTADLLTYWNAAEIVKLFC